MRLRLQFACVIYTRRNAPPVSTLLSSSMSPADSQPSTPTPTSPPRPRSSNKVLPSPLRPNSVPAPQPSSSPRPMALPIASPSITPPERSKTKAMDLLRKHYGLSVTPPPPSGRPTDPLDLGQSSPKNILPHGLTRSQTHRPSIRRRIMASSLLRHRSRRC
jgi:hypothetical protein